MKTGTTELVGGLGPMLPSARAPRVLRQGILNDVRPVVELQARQNFIIRVGDDSFECLDELSSLPEGKDVVDEVERLVQRHTRKRAALCSIRPFLYHLGRWGRYDDKSISAYRQHCLYDGNRSANTRYIMFGYALQLTKALIRSGVLVDVQVPHHLPMEDHASKASLFSASPIRSQELGAELRKSIVSMMERYNLPEQEALVATVLSDRMNRLRAAAAEEIYHIKKNFEETRDFLAAAKKDAHLIRCASMARASSLERRGLPELLVWGHSHYGLNFPSVAHVDPTFYASLKKMKIGIRSILERLQPTVSTLAPFIVLFLCEPTCAPNVSSVAQGTFRGCVGRGSTSGMASITFWKDRPFRKQRKKEIERNIKIVELLTGKEQYSRTEGKKDISLVHALEFLHEYTKPLLDRQLKIAKSAQLSGTERGVKLFLHLDRQRTNVVKPLDEGTITDAVAAFVKRAAASDPTLSCLVGRVTGENFRPSHSQLHHLLGGNILQVQALLGHSSVTTTQGYMASGHAGNVGRSKIAAFQDFIERSAREAEPLGNGFLCSDREGGPDRDSRSTQECLRLDACQSCPASRIVFGNADIAADWLAWVDHITFNKQQLVQSSPERWEHIWLPQLALFKTLLEKAGPGTCGQARSILRDVPRSLPPLS